MNDEECGRWRNGKLVNHCLKLGSEECDFDCPHGALSEHIRKKDRNYSWDIQLDLSPNAVSHLLNALDAYAQLNGVEAPEHALHNSLIEKLRDAHAK